jgi:hypothetical protein
METIENKRNITTKPLDEVNADEFKFLYKDMRRRLRETQELVMSDRSNLHPSEMSLGPKGVALRRAREEFVNNAEFMELKLFAEVLLSSQEYLRNQQELNSVNSAIYEKKKTRNKNGSLSTEENGALETDYMKKKELLAKILPFNHSLRELISVVADHVDRKELEDWLGGFMGDTKAANQIIAGMGAEVAVYRAAAKEFGSANVHLSDLAQDARGVDLIVVIGGAPREIDVKTGGNQAGGLGKSHEVDIEQSMLDGFDIKPEYIQGVISQIKDSIR